MRSDIVKMYKDVHTWVGITTGLALFIAFYAGAITMFEEPLKRWASPPTDLVMASLQETPRLIEATIAENEDARGSYTIHIKTGPETPGRMSWVVWPEGRFRGAPTETYWSGFGSDGSVAVVKGESTELAQFIDDLHRKVGLPFSHEIAMPIMGTVALLYFMALVSGIIVLLPSFVKDLFALRLGKNLKRMWLDLHNVLGVFSLPFHIIMALTAIIFAFHDQFYDVQNKVAYDGRLPAMFEANEDPHHVNIRKDQPFLSPATLIEKLGEQEPDYAVRELVYRIDGKGEGELAVNGERPGYGHRGPNYGIAMADPYTGEIMSGAYLPGRQENFTAITTSFFALHFGNFGGAGVRWGYFFLGLAGAFLFYSGNLLWIETRRKKRRKAGQVEQPVKTKIMGALTVGVCLGCIAGISLTIAAAKVLPGFVSSVASWHLGIYYTVFMAAIAWAFFRGAARGAVDLLLFAAITTILIPLVSLISAIGDGIGWNYGAATAVVDVTAFLGALALILIAHQTRKRISSAPVDSIWHVESAKPFSKILVSRPVKSAAEGRQ